MKKTIGMVLILIATLIVLTGCSIDIDYEVRINSNGSGEISYIYGYSKDTLESLQTPSDQLVKKQKEQAEEHGYKTEEYKDDKIEGFIATKHIKDITKEFDLKEFGDDYIDKDKSIMTINKSLFKTEIYQKTEVDLVSLNDVQSAVNIKYTVKLPVKVHSNNATEVSNNGMTAVWKLNPGEVNIIEFTASGINVSSIIFFILLIAIIIACVLYFVMFFNKKKEVKVKITKKTTTKAKAKAEAETETKKEKE